jgi:3D (Asp-Asp-Asp) domain-containing protein
VTARRALTEAPPTGTGATPEDGTPDDDPSSLVGPPPEDETEPDPGTQVPEPDPPLSDVLRTVEAPITYYYCSAGSNPASYGGGGGFCGYTASGELVRPGGASCARENLGQRFRIVGDPLQRVYTCIDTGGGVFGEHRDIWFENSDDAYAWWVVVGSTATIEILFN